MKIYKKFVGISLTAVVTSFMFLGMLQMKQKTQEIYTLPWQQSLHKQHILNSITQHEDRPPTYVNNTSHIWPSSNVLETEDRIVEQLYKYKAPVREKKTILVVSGPNDHNSRLHSENCPVTDCVFTERMQDASKSAAVIFFNNIAMPDKFKMLRPRNQIWILYLLESPHHSISLVERDLINWTATYRRDSVIVTPYEKFVFFKNYTGLPEKAKRNYADGKTKKVAWFVSNCNPPNGRDKYVEQLKKYIDVDIYGGCGTKQCPRGSGRLCDNILNTDYKFYLSFENSNCKDYITEKLYWNALGNDIVPVVMGAHPDDYQAVAPPHSYIHVDDFQSPKQLAEYLHKLDQNDDLYNSYFRWKGTGEFINTKFWCRLCNMVHAAESDGHRMSYTDFHTWWKGPDICVKPPSNNLWASWRGQSSRNDERTLKTVKVYNNKR